MTATSMPQGSFSRAGMRVSQEESPSFPLRRHPEAEVGEDVNKLDVHHTPFKILKQSNFIGQACQANLHTVTIPTHHTKLFAMTTPMQSRSELNALFEPSTKVSTTKVSHLFSTPRNLDSAIMADLEYTSPIPVFRWYVGTDTYGVNRIFRFQRGGSLEKWHQRLSAQTLINVQGPFKSAGKAVLLQQSSTTLHT